MSRSRTRLRGLTWDHPRGYRGLEAATRRFAAEHDVDVSWTRRSLTSFGDTPIDALARDYDLLILDHPHIGIAAQTACLLPLDDLLPPATLDALAAQSAGPSHASYRYGEGQWALAVDAAVQVTSYRPDLAPEPLPVRWEEIPGYAAQLAERGLSMALPLVAGDAICCFLTLCASFGAPIREDDPFPGNVAVAALAFLRRLARLAHPRSTEWNPIALYERMAAQDEVAYCPLAFGYRDYARPHGSRRALRFADLPAPRRGLLGGAGVAVSAATRAPESAARLAAWLCSAEVQRGIYVEAGGQPGNRAAWTDRRSNDLAGGYFAATLDTLERAYVRPRDPGYLPWQVEAGRSIHAFLLGEDDPAALAAELGEAFDARWEGVEA